MARSDRPSGHEVDFVVGDEDDGADEELPQSARAGSSTRLRVGVGAGVLALLAVVLVARTAAGPQSTPQAAPPTSAAPSSAVVAPGPVPTGPVTAPPLVFNGDIPSAEATSTPVDLPARVPTRRGHDPQKCPGLRCTSTGRLPVAVSEAVQDAFPESTIERTVTVRLRGAGHLLWYREVDVQVASEFMTLRVEAPAHGQRTGSGVRTDADATTSFDDGTLGPWHVTVQVVDRLGGKADPGLLSRLAHDARIVST